MTLMNAGGQILKVDSRGRVRTSPEQREEILAAYDASTMSAAAFAVHVGIKYPTLASWIQERRRRGAGGSQKGASVNWVEAVVEEGCREGEGKLRVEVCGCAVFEIRSEQEAAIAALFVKGLAGVSRV